MKKPQNSSNEQLQDIWTSAVLKNVDLPATLPSHVEAFTQALKKPERRPGWVLPSGFVVVAGSAALIGALVLYRPTPSFAAPTLRQVDQAALAAKSFTVVHRMNDGKTTLYMVTESRDGDRWKTTFGLSAGRPFGQVVMDGHQTVSVLRYRNRIEVLIDGPSKAPNKQWELPTPQNFLAVPSEFFQSHPGKVTVTRGVQWNGRIVDEFENIEVVNRGAVKTQIRHVLYADPTDHLPLQLETTQSNPKLGLGETITYSYTPLQDSDFVASVPAGAKVTDVRKERQAVHNAITKSGLVIVDEDFTLGVFMPAQLSKSANVRLRIDGSPVTTGQPRPVLISNDGSPDTKSPWRQRVIYTHVSPAKQKLLRRMKLVKVLLNGKAYTMPIKRVANTPFEFIFPGQRL